MRDILPHIGGSDSIKMHCLLDRLHGSAKTAATSYRETHPKATTDDVMTHLQRIFRKDFSREDPIDKMKARKWKPDERQSNISLTRPHSFKKQESEKKKKLTTIFYQEWEKQ